MNAAAAAAGHVVSGSLDGVVAWFGLTAAGLLEAAVFVVGAVRASCGTSRGIGGATRGVFFPADEETLGGSGLVFLAGDELLLQVKQAADPPPDGMLASYLEVIEPQAPLTLEGFSLIRGQGITTSAAKI